MSKHPSTVLVVDDHAQWRRYLCSMLLRAPGEWQIVGEAADGQEAVRRAESLDPDLILMDIGLPGLNGIEAASRILARRPGSRILFVSQQMSRDVLRAAAAAGASGYVLKSDAGSDLLPALAAIADGGRCFSRRLRADHRHELYLYSDETSLIEKYAAFVEEALRLGDMVFTLTGDSRHLLVQQNLERRGVDVNRAIQERRYLPMSARAMLSKVMVNGWPDETRFTEAWLPLIEQAGRRERGGSPLRLSGYGDASPSLWQEGRHDAAAQMERLCDAFCRLHHIEVLCGYPLTVAGESHEAGAFQHICDAHSLVA